MSSETANSASTEAARNVLFKELSEGLPEWMAERVMEAVDDLVLNRIADMLEAASDRLEAGMPTPRQPPTGGEK